jgi:hypothetical protein
MLILAEGMIRKPIEGEARAAVRAWLGPMADDGFLEAGYLDREGNRLWMYISSPDIATATRRLNDLPVVRDGSLTITTRRVTRLRFD